MHVEQTKRVRPFRPDRVGAASLGVLKPGVAEERFRVVAGRPAGRAPGAAGVFPFGLGGQPTSPPVLRRQPAAEGSRVVPGHVDDRLVVPLWPGEAGVAPAVAKRAVVTFTLILTLTVVGYPPSAGLRVGNVAGRGDERAELADGDFGRPQLERGGDPHEVPWPLIGTGGGLSSSAPIRN